MFKLKKPLLNSTILLSVLGFASETQANAMTIDGLKAPANVTRDVDGIAHVAALNEHDMFFLQGWTHAEDRLFQMDLNRRQPSGTLAEVLGEAALSSDVELRTIGLRRSAERSLHAIETAAANGDAIAKGALDALHAYAKGVNAVFGRS